MFLELTTVPNLDTIGAIGFAYVPWQLPLLDGANLRERVLKTQNAFITRYGPGFRFRLVLETREEWARIETDHINVISVSPNMYDERVLASWLDLDSVEWPGPRGFSPLEEAAIGAIRGVLGDYERRTGKTPVVWMLADEQSRKNLARAAEFCGLRLEAPEAATRI